MSEALLKNICESNVTQHIVNFIDENNKLNTLGNESREYIIFFVNCTLTSSQDRIEVVRASVCPEF